jgi:hypothetical protein
MTIPDRPSITKRASQTAGAPASSLGERDKGEEGMTQAVPVQRVHIRLSRVQTWLRELPLPQALRLHRGGRKS